jgi:23S rRNA (pseudouridine1915-N3)-methyltransferase
LFFAMKITLIQIGKTHFDFIDEGFQTFARRINRYAKFNSELIELPSRLKSDVPEIIKKNEAEALLKKIQTTDFVVLLDEKGKSFASVSYAGHLQKLFQNYSHIVFIIGGAYGFHADVYKRANEQLSLSAMTFSHQLIRLIFAEQLYRLFTIIKGEPYHHE